MVNAALNRRNQLRDAMMYPKTSKVICTCILLTSLSTALNAVADGTNMVYKGTMAANAAGWTQAIWQTNNGANNGVGTAQLPVPVNTYTVISNASTPFGNNVNNARVR